MPGGGRKRGREGERKGVREGGKKCQWRGGTGVIQDICQDEKK